MTLLDRTLTTEQLAKLLNRNPGSIVRWRRQRQGPPYLRIEGRVLYDRQAVEKWLQDQMVQAGAA